jgi:trehalose 6-phosphate phosphatase
MGEATGAEFGMHASPYKDSQEEPTLAATQGWCRAFRSDTRLPVDESLRGAFNQPGMRERWGAAVVSDTRPTARGDGALADGCVWALFLDFDGTLVEIADRPDAVIVPPELQPTLRALRDGLGGAMAIVTGRSIAVIDGFLDPDRFDVAGLHGAEYRLAGELFPCRPQDHPDLRSAIEELEDRFASEPGILIEDKGCSVAVHWRLAPEAEELASATIGEMAAVLGPAYRLQLGKAVAEVLPARATKGGIIRHFLTQGPYRGRSPIFIGDDLTDEQAFEAVDAAGGISIRVGQGPTRARYRMAAPSALREVLARWAQLARIDFAGLSPASLPSEHARLNAPSGAPARL